jgi:succinylglutamic semialdehyde dehydrogenase
LGQLSHELPPAPSGAPGEQRFHPLGVVGIIGPYNFPLHLVNTHLVPALVTGNCVVVKPSEVTPLAAQRYAGWFADPEVGLPPGVFNLVHGLGEVGAALVDAEAVNGLVFTGSYDTGRRIRQATFDRPWKKVCLELGGKNPAVVLDDADLEQAVREISLGALLTTGQRCTATSRVVATPGIADALRRRLVEVFERVTPGAPTAPETFMGPLATRAAHARFVAACARARAEGLEPLVESRTLPGGAYVTPALYGAHGDEPSVRDELFGPHVAFEVACDESDAFARAAASPYGLSASLFSARTESFERFYDEVPAGVLNFNRSTNGASGLLPFGGIGMSGNWHAAGSAAPRLATYPVAVMAVATGLRTPNPQLDPFLSGV